MVLVYRRVVFAVVLITLLFTHLLARGDDVEDLKATFEQIFQALNAGDLDAYLAMVHDQEISFGPDAPFARDGKAATRQGLQTLLANHESITRTPINPQFRVIGTTGLVWSHAAVTYKPKDGPVHTLFARHLWTFAKVEGKWLLVASHISRIPTGS